MDRSPRSIIAWAVTALLVVIGLFGLARGSMLPGFCMLLAAALVAPPLRVLWTALHVNDVLRIGACILLFVFGGLMPTTQPSPPSVPVVAAPTGTPAAGSAQPEMVREAEALWNDVEKAAASCDASGETVIRQLTGEDAESDDPDLATRARDACWSAKVEIGKLSPPPLAQGAAAEQFKTALAICGTAYEDGATLFLRVSELADRDAAHMPSAQMEELADRHAKGKAVCRAQIVGASMKAGVDPMGFKASAPAQPAAPPPPLPEAGQSRPTATPVPAGIALSDLFLEYPVASAVAASGKSGEPVRWSARGLTGSTAVEQSGECRMVRYVVDGHPEFRATAMKVCP